jgi:hypothetical protein
MTLINSLITVLGSLLMSFGINMYIASVNMKYTKEFMPIPHFLSSSALSFALGIFCFAILGIILLYSLFKKKYVRFGFGLIGVILFLVSYTAVSSAYSNPDMAFIVAWVEGLEKLGYAFAIGFILQGITNGVLRVSKVGKK